MSFRTMAATRESESKAHGLETDAAGHDSSRINYVVYISHQFFTVACAYAQQAVFVTDGHEKKTANSRAEFRAMPRALLGTRNLTGLGRLGQCFDCRACLQLVLWNKTKCQTSS